METVKSITYSRNRAENSDSKLIRTQISAKYSPDNPQLFHFKQQLIAAGLDVRFPVGDSILHYSFGFAITHPDEAITPFQITQINFFREIKVNDLQVTYNVYGNKEGYMGESSGIETAYAMLCQKPIVLLRQPQSYSESIPNGIRTIIEDHKHGFMVHDLDNMEPNDIRRFTQYAVRQPIDYRLSCDERRVILNSLLNLSREYSRCWQQFRTQ